jgi:hypothetical protein
MKTNIIDQITDELSRAKAKYPTWPTDPLHALAVLGEEYGELTKAMLQMTYEPHKTTPEDVRMEAIQTAAMALRLAISLNKYEYNQSAQHNQGITENLEDEQIKFDWDGELTKIQAIKIFESIANQDDPYWENVVEDFYDEDQTQCHRFTMYFKHSVLQQRNT